MNTDQTFSRGQVALALGLDVRQLESWATQGLITPAVLRGRTQNGNRRAYRFADALAAAVLAEVQGLLGKGFRPGSLAALLTKELAKALRSPQYGPLLAATPPGTVLVVSGKKGRPTLAIEVLYHTHVQHLPSTALTIKLDVLVDRVRRALANA